MGLAKAVVDVGEERGSNRKPIVPVGEVVVEDFEAMRKILMYALEGVKVQWP